MATLWMSCDSSSPSPPSSQTPTPAQQEEKHLMERLHRMAGGESENWEKIAKKDRKKCNAGHQASCVNLAILLERGRGVSKDGAAAMRLYNEACKHKLKPACWHAASAWDQGKIVPRDYTKARELYQEGCNAQHPNSCVGLGFMHVYGKGAPKNLDKGIEAFEKACKLGTGCGHRDYFSKERDKEKTAGAGRQVLPGPEAEAHGR